MTYIEIISQLGLIIEDLKEKKEISTIFDPAFLNSFNTYFNELNTNYNTLLNDTKIYIDENKEILLAFYQNIKEINDDSTDKIINLDEEKHNKEIEINKKIESEKERLDTINKDENSSISAASKRISIEIFNNDTYTSQEISDIKNKKEPNDGIYNHYIDQFNKESDQKYLKFHSQMSKLQYNLLDANNSLIDSYSKYNDNIEKKIEDLNNTLKLEQIKLNEAIVDLETKLNNKIKDILKKYNQIEENNKVVFQNEMTSLHKKLEQIDNKYNSLIKEINKDSQNNLKNIDTKLDSDTKKYKQQIQDKIYHNNIKIKLDLDTINSLKEALKNKEISDIERKTLKAKIKFEIHKSNVERKEREFNILAIQKKLNFLTYSSMHNKQTIENKRKYLVSLKNIENKIEQNPILKEILVKEHYNNFNNKLNNEISKDKATKLQNDLNKEINNEKKKSELAILKKKEEYNLFDAKIQIEINKLKKQSYNLLIDKALTKDISSEILSYNQVIDDLTKKYYLNMSLLNIEKNKHLLSMNTELIDFEIKNKNYDRSHFEEKKHIEFRQIKSKANENINFNNLALNIYIQIKNNEELKAKLDQKNNLSKVEARKNFDLSNQKYIVQLKRRLKDIKLMRENTKFFSTILLSFKNTFLSHLSKSIEKIKNNEISSTVYKNYFTKIINTIIDLIEEFRLREQKILDDHIRLDTGTKYSTIYSNIEYEYSQKNENFTKQIDQLQKTISNYQNGIASFYNQIRDLTLQVNKDSDSIKDTNETERKATKKNIIDLKKQINNYQNKIELNNDKILDLKKEIILLNKKISQLNKNKSTKLAQTKKNELKESEVSLNTKNKINQVCDKYVSFLKNIYQENYLNKLLFENKYQTNHYKFIHFVEYNLNQFNLSFKNIIDEYEHNLSSSLDNLKHNFTSSYEKSLKLAQKVEKKDLIYNQKENDRLEKVYNQNLNLHKENINTIDSKIDSLNLDEENKYNETIRLLNLDRKQSHDKYFMHFKSCDDLIKYSTDTFNKESKILKDLENKKINNHVAIKKQEKINKFFELNQLIKKYSNEIEVVPKYTKEQSDIIIESYNEQNETLSNLNNQIKEDCKLFASNTKKEEQVSEKEYKSLKKKEFYNYKKALSSFSKEYKAKEKDNKKIKLNKIKKKSR